MSVLWATRLINSPETLVLEQLLGPYISRISAVGPSIGALFPVWGMQGSLNFRGDPEFAAQNWSSGWNTWLVFSIATAPTE